ncbi:carnitine O-acetyltransferase-like isoform X2 [Gopherus flavomarginatus]|uniref:carnitine O-acetyltransferase-like isoform X2 n=1 Tax=Gopherus flavomarginatus TaxID=286002 RepID=UPI0021CBCF71|nr:carnitine O-acetyltransferase-like isoform X2 [Gopherus flavomarginatus]
MGRWRLLLPPWGCARAPGSRAPFQPWGQLHVPRAAGGPVGAFEPFPSLQRPPSRCLASSFPLPRQPVPPLAQTLERYLRSLEVLVTPEELEETRQLVQEFGAPGGEGERLQAQLERRAARMENWLSDWWVQSAYLESRLPLTVHSSPAVVLPKQDYSDWRGQLRFAAKLIAGVLDFKAKIDQQALLVEYRGGHPQCMAQYSRLFASCRLPGPKHDGLLLPPPGRRAPTFITVVRNFQFFQLEVYNSDGTPLTVDQLHLQLQRIRGLSWKTDKEPLGVLTGDHRHTWGQAYSTLMRDRLNRESARCIQRSLFTVCLDAPVLKVSDERYPSRVAAQMLHGGGSYSNSGNRWFDKTLQFIVGEDGVCGVLYEQAMADGAPIATIIDHVLDYCLITDLDISCFTYRGFGQGLPKRWGLRPDSLFQVALQLAYYRTHGSLCATSEVVSLRRFHLGRTDAVRPAAPPVLRLARAMETPHSQDEETLALLQAAVESQSARTEQVLAGQGIDRHLLGLKLAAIGDGQRLPGIFMDTAYAIATHCRLLTGQVASRSDCLMVYGPQVPDGYGVCYNPLDAHVNFAITAFNCCRETHAQRLAHTLQRVLDQLARLLGESPGGTGGEGGGDVEGQP